MGEDRYGDDAGMHVTDSWRSTLQIVVMGSPVQLLAQSGLLVRHSGTDQSLIVSEDSCPTECAR